MAARKWKQSTRASINVQDSNLDPCKCKLYLSFLVWVSVRPIKLYFRVSCRLTYQTFSYTIKMKLWLVQSKASRKNEPFGSWTMVSLFSFPKAWSFSQGETGAVFSSSRFLRYPGKSACQRRSMRSAPLSYTPFQCGEATASGKPGIRVFLPHE